MWAVLSDPAKKGGKWNMVEFLATGETDVSRFVNILSKHAHLKVPFGDVLDFGCGVGRLSLAWASRAKSVTGVDVAPTMIQLAEKVLQGTPNARVRVNVENNLRQFSDQSFDVVSSYITIQHIPPAEALIYIREFCRLLRPGGFLIFQAITERQAGDWKGWIGDWFPWLVEIHHRLIKGFRVFVLPEKSIFDLMQSMAMETVFIEDDPGAGQNVTSRVFLFRKN